MSIKNDTNRALIKLLIGADTLSRVDEINARAVEVWERYKAEEISGTEFVTGIKALEAELPAGMNIRFG